MLYNREYNESSRIKVINRREEVKKQKYIILIISFLLITMISLFSIKAHAYASDHKQAPVIKTFSSITIYSGDTLTSIAESHMGEEYASAADYIKEVAFMNNMNTEDILIPGNHLIIPIYVQ